MRLYRVVIERGGRPLKYREKGGGVFSSARTARDRAQWLVNTGVNAVVLESQDIEWHEIPVFDD
jgi:hypothetical protein